MNIMPSKAFQFFAALLAFFAFTADVLDDISDRAVQADVSQSSHSGHHHKGTGDSCAGHTHDEHAIAAVVVLSVPAKPPQVFVFPPVDEVDPPGLAASIDHPPQLA